MKRWPEWLGVLLLLMASSIWPVAADEKTTPACCASTSSMHGVILPLRAPSAGPTPTAAPTSSAAPTATAAPTPNASPDAIGTAPQCTFRRADGRVFAVLAAPTLPKLPERGLAVEIKATVVLVDGKEALRIDEVHLLKGASTPLAERKFPLRARCAHCGCRMQIDTPEALSKPCEACKCNKTNEECLHY